MKRTIKITYNSGDEALYTAKTPEFVKWEKETNKTILDMNEKSGLWDLMFLAYHAYKREAGGKPVKSFDNWVETVSEFDVVKDGDADPKVIQQEA
jgi:hypothetical protein